MHRELNKSLTYAVLPRHLGAYLKGLLTKPLVESIPHCNEHRIITKLVVDKLCGEFEAFADLCQLVSDNNLEVLLNYVCDPDINHYNLFK